MNKRTVALIAICLLASGCRSIHNEFRSSSIVGYVAPEGNIENPTITGDRGSYRRHIQHLNHSLNNETNQEERKNAESLLITAGTCIAIDVAGSYFSQPFETGPEKRYAAIFNRTALSELVLSVKVNERLSSNVPKEGESSSSTGSEHTLMTWTGQQPGRPLPFQGLPIYGPKIYQGGDLMISLRLSELDKDEINQLSERFGGIIEQASATLPEAEREVGALQMIANSVLVDSFKWTGSGVTLVGLKAAEAAAETFKYMHEDEDSIIDLTFLLTGATPTTSSLVLPSLREGYYPIIRASIGEDFPNDFKKMMIDTRYPRMHENGERIWMILRVRRAGGCVAPG